MLEEFKKFAMRGNVLDMAIGIIIGAAFGKIITSFVNDILMPPIGILIGGVNFSHLAIILQKATANSAAVTINYGVFIQTVLDFLIIAFAIFIMIRQVNKLQKKEGKKDSQPSEDILLLREIRDNLKK